MITKPQQLMTWLTGVWLLLCPGVQGQQSGSASGAWFTQPHMDRKQWLPEHETLAGNMGALIGAARERIRFAMLRLDLPVVVEALVLAHRRGVDVRVLTDDDISTHSYRSAYVELRSAGVPVHTDRGHLINANVHHKFLIVDQKFVWTGDWNACSADTHQSWHAALRIESPGLAADYEAQFQKLWDGEGSGFGSSYDRPRPWHDLSRGGRASVHFGFEEDLRDVVVEQIAAARERIDLAHAFFQDLRVVLALLHAAQRGVSVRVVYANASGIVRTTTALARFGVPVRQVLHPNVGAKFLLIDGARLVTGSYNCTADPDHENLLILENVPEVITVYETLMSRLWSAGTPFFKSALTPSLPPKDRQRIDAVARLLEHPASQAQGPPIATHRAELLPLLAAETPRVVPTHMAWRRDSSSGRALEVTLTLSRAGAPDAREHRVVVSTTPLNDSLGPGITPDMIPVDLTPRHVEALDAPWHVTWNLEYPIPGRFRIDVDILGRQPGRPWKRLQTYHVPDFAHHVDDGVQGDKEGGLSVLHEVSAEPGSSLLATAPLTGVFDWDVEVNPRRATHVAFEYEARGTWQAELSFLDAAARTEEVHPLRTALVCDGQTHRMVLDLSRRTHWLDTPRIRGVRVRVSGRGGDVLVRRLQFLGDPLLGPAAAAGNSSFSTLLINGSDGGLERRIWCRNGQPIQVTVKSPTGEKRPFTLLGIPRIPSPEDATMVGEREKATLVFSPPFSEPDPSIGFALADSASRSPHAPLRPGSAPVTFTLPPLAGPGRRHFTLQAVFAGTPIAVSNAITVVVH